MADEFDYEELDKLEDAIKRSSAHMQQAFIGGFDRLEASLRTLTQQIVTMARVIDGLSPFPSLTSTVDHPQTTTLEKEINQGTQECLVFMAEENKTDERSGSRLPHDGSISGVLDSSMATNVLMLPHINEPADASKFTGNFPYSRITTPLSNPKLDNSVNKFFPGFMVLDNSANGRLKDDLLHDALCLIPLVIKPVGLAPSLPSLHCSIKDYAYIGFLMARSWFLDIDFLQVFFPHNWVQVQHFNCYPLPHGLIFDPGIGYYTPMTGSQLDFHSFTHAPLLIICENILYEFLNLLQHSYALSLYCCSGDKLDLFLWVVHGMLLRLVFDPSTFNSIKFYYLKCRVVVDTVWIYYDFITHIFLGRHCTLASILAESHDHYCPTHFPTLKVHLSCLINYSLIVLKLPITLCNFCLNIPTLYLSSIKGFDLRNAKENWSLTLDDTPWPTLLLQTPNFDQALEYAGQRTYAIVKVSLAIFILQLSLSNFVFPFTCTSREALLTNDQSKMDFGRRLLDLFDNISIRLWKMKLSTKLKYIQKDGFVGSLLLFWGQLWCPESQGLNFRFIYDPGGVISIFSTEYIFQFCLLQEVVSLELLYICLSKCFTSFGLDNCIWANCSKKIKYCLTLSSSKSDTLYFSGSYYYWAKVQLGIIILGPTTVIITFEIVGGAYEWHCVALQPCENYIRAMLESVVNKGFLYVASSPLDVSSISTILLTRMPYINSSQNFISFVELLLVHSRWFHAVFVDNKFQAVGVFIWFPLWVLNSYRVFHCGSCLLGNVSQIMYTKSCQVQTLVLSCSHFMSKRKGELHFVVLILVEFSGLSHVIDTVAPPTNINVIYPSRYMALSSGKWECNLLLLCTHEKQFHDLEDKVAFNGGSNVTSTKEMGLDGLSPKVEHSRLVKQEGAEE